MDRAAQWATVCRVAKSQVQLKQKSRNLCIHPSNHIHPLSVLPVQGNKVASTLTLVDKSLFFCLSWEVFKGTSQIAQLVKNLPAMQETPVRFLGREDLLEKGKDTYSRILGFPLWLSW